jgi:dihydroorotate dehydrogenase (fumarate)
MTTEPGPDLAATYLGLPLTSPLVGSASPLWWDLEAMRAAQDAGMGAIVLPSLYEEEIEREAHQLQRLLAQGSGAFVEAATYLPELEEYRTGPAPYLRHLELAATTLTVPVIGSLNGVTPGGWLEYSTMMAEAGAAAVELNPYLVAADPAVSAAEVEDRLVELVAQVVSEVGVPVAVKLSPWFSALANLAVRLVRAGAAGLVLFNRFVQPDVDLDRLTTVDDVRLSTPAELLLPLRWVALLRDRVDCSLALSGGVHSGDDAAKAVLVGADAVMATSVLLERGPDHVASLVAGLRSRLTAHGYTSVGQARGAMSAHNVAEPEAYERAWYHHALTHWPSGTSPERG